MRATESNELSRWNENGSADEGVGAMMTRTVRRRCAVHQSRLRVIAERFTLSGNVSGCRGTFTFVACAKLRDRDLRGSLVICGRCAQEEVNSAAITARDRSSHPALSVTLSCSTIRRVLSMRGGTNKKEVSGEFVLGSA
jgi:hypothetical protein